jgi:aryl-alcohol dehydrogenase-like predicted oxidoreductase
VTAAQIALGWVYVRSRRLGVKAIPIPGTRKRQRLEENVTAPSLELSDEAMAVLEPLAAAVRGMAV